MKNLISLLLCITMAYSMSACAKAPQDTGAGPTAEKEASEISEPAETEKEQGVGAKEGLDIPDNNVPLFVEMYAADARTDGKKTLFVLKNNSDEEYIYGPEYALEEQADGEWLEIELEYPLSWNAVVYKLAPQSEQEIEVDWTMGYGELPEGSYRLKKTVRDNNGSRAIVYAQFCVSELCGLPLAPEGFSKP